MTQTTAGLLLSVSALLLGCSGADSSEGRGATEAGPEASVTSGTTASGSTTGARDDDSGTGTDESSSGDTGLDCTPLPWFPDVDGDGFGPDGAVVMTCAPPPGHVPNGGDCDDADAAVNISADETCDGADNDCDGLADEPAETNLSCGGCSLVEAGASGYAVCLDPLGWSEAQAHCETSFGGTLVVIDSAGENAAVVALEAAKVPSVWLGLSDLETEGTFVWPDGTPPRFTNWNKGEPNDAAGNEDCTQLARATAVWNDLDCAVVLPYICEVAL